MKPYSSTLIKYFNNNCPRALKNYEDDVPRDQDIFQVGIAAHAVLQVVGEQCGTDISRSKEIGDAVVLKLTTEGRSFNGRPEPPMSPERALEGRDIALDYIIANGLPADGRYEIGLGMTAEGCKCAYDAKECRFRAITDVIYQDVEGDEDFQANVMVVRDYKSAWPTNADELDTLQRKGQAVLTWLHYQDNEDIQGIKMEVINLRTHQDFSRVIWFDEEGIELLSSWVKDLLITCKAMDKTREARPGGGCLGCAWCITCEASYYSIINSEGINDALGLICLEAKRAELLKVLKAQITEGSITVPGGEVGYIKKTEKKPSDNAVLNILLDFYRKVGVVNVEDEDIQVNYNRESSLLSGLKLTGGNINNIAKTLYDKKEMTERNNLLERCLDDNVVTRFGVQKL